MRLSTDYQDGVTGGITPPGQPVFRGTAKPLALVVWLFVSVLLSACMAAVPSVDNENGVQIPANERLSDISSVDLPVSEPIIIPDVTAVINTEGSRANVRSGPELDAPIIAKANPGDSFNIQGRSEDNEWWLICCVRGPGDEAGDPTESAWIASVVADAEGNEDAIPVVKPILADDVAASWEVVWQCGSERCEVKQCAAEVAAATNDATDQHWLEIEHVVTWDDACFPAESWKFEVDRYTGKERTGDYVDNFLLSYWLGEQPGPATNIYTLDDGRKVAVWCSGPSELEVQEEDGWTAVFEGGTCHDIETGELISRSYTVRYLFSGEYEGQQYERAYFGDYELLEQRLLETNAPLAYIE